MACCCVVTSTGTVKMVESCGKFSHIAQPGLSCVIPFINNVSGTVSMRLQQMEVSCETKTKDNVFVGIKIAIQYRVVNEKSKIVDAHYRLTNPRVQVRGTLLGHRFCWCFPSTAAAPPAANGCSGRRCRRAPHRRTGAPGPPSCGGGFEATSRLQAPAPCPSSSDFPRGPQR